MKKFKAESGSTFISVMVSAAVVSGIVASAYSSLNQIKISSDSNLQGTQLCRVAAQNVLSSIRSSGASTRIYKTPIDANSINLNDSSWQSGSKSYSQGAVVNESGLSLELNQFRWPNLRVVDWSSRPSAPAVSQAPKAIYSYMNSLATVYNSNNSVCSNLNGVEISSLGVWGWGPGATLGPYDVKTYLRIRPYSTVDGSYSCSLTNEDWPRPYAKIEPPMAEQLGIIDLSNFNPDIGFEVEVSVVLKKTAGMTNKAEVNAYTHDCSATEKFNYDVIKDPLPVPSVGDVSGRLEVSIPSGIYTLGSQLLCRADSHLYDATFSNPRPPTSTGPGDNWRPCDQVTNICGTDFGPAVFSQDHNSVSIDLPTDPLCVFEYEAILLDSVGNMSSVVGVSGFNGTLTPIAPYDPAAPSSSVYSVDGVNYNSTIAAQRASLLSGAPIINIPGPDPDPRDIELNNMYDSMERAAEELRLARISFTSAKKAYLAILNYRDDALLSSDSAFVTQMLNYAQGNLLILQNSLTSIQANLLVATSENNNTISDATTFLSLTFGQGFATQNKARANSNYSMIKTEEIRDNVNVLLSDAQLAINQISNHLATLSTF